MEKWQKQVNMLKIYLSVVTILLLALIVITVNLLRRGNSFGEISAERINIVESDGSLRMAISNHQRQDPGAYDGKKIPARDRPAGKFKCRRDS